jgi:hypothetical protein
MVISSRAGEIARAAGEGAWGGVIPWFPSSCLGASLAAKLHFAYNYLMLNTISLSHDEVTNQSLGHKYIPKQELGNEIKGIAGVMIILRKLSNPAIAPIRDPSRR